MVTPVPSPCDERDAFSISVVLSPAFTSSSSKHLGSRGEGTLQIQAFSLASGKLGGELRGLIAQPYEVRISSASSWARFTSFFEVLGAEQPPITHVLAHRKALKKGWLSDRSVANSIRVMEWGFKVSCARRKREFRLRFRGSRPVAFQKRRLPAPLGPMTPKISLAHGEIHRERRGPPKRF